MAKRGRMSDQEKKFLDKFMVGMNNKDLAEKLGRTVKFVSDYRKSRPHTIKTEEEEEIMISLHNLYFWPELKTQFHNDELRSFEFRWVALNQQFQDVLPTDQMQIKDLITLELLINRVLTEKMQALKMIEKLEKEIDKEEDRPMEDRDVNLLMSLETQLNAAMASQNARTTEHMKLQEKKDAKFKDLKATRDQRFKQLEDSKKNFFDLIKTLDERHMREKEGRQMELMRLAAEKVAKDLGEYTEYDDGTVDQPFLNSETLPEDEKDK